jgi:hypothetical protein
MNDLVHSLLKFRFYVSLFQKRSFARATCYRYERKGLGCTMRHSIDMFLIVLVQIGFSDILLFNLNLNIMIFNILISCVIFNLGLKF